MLAQNRQTGPASGPWAQRVSAALAGVCVAMAVPAAAAAGPPRGAALARDGVSVSPVEVVALEVTQGVQDWRDSVPLVAERPTVVRVFVQVPSGTPPQEVALRLVGRRDGAPLPGSPLTAINDGGSVVARPDAAARRAFLNDSLVFELPASWRSGPVELALDSQGTALSCQETAGPVEHDCAATVAFTLGSHARLNVVGVPVTTGNTTRVPTGAAMDETAERVMSSLPAARLTFAVTDQLFTTLPGPNPKLAVVNNALAMQRALDNCFTAQGCTTLYYGQLSGTLGGGLANGIPGDVASGWDYNLTQPGSTGFFRNVAAHEVGHLIGLSHSVRGPVVLDKDGDPVKEGPCGEVADPTAPDYPYFGPYLGGIRSLMGPPDAGPDEQRWGFDVRYARDNLSHLAVVAPIGPQATFDLMGYCWVASPSDNWPSDYTWALLRQGLASRFGQADTMRAVDLNGGTTLLFPGVIAPDTDAATIEAPAELTGDIPAARSGPYELRLLDGIGSTLASVPFAPSADTARPRSGEEAPDGATFLVPVAKPVAPVAKIQVWHGATKVGEVVASPHAPTVNILEPATGSTQAGPTVRVAWTGADLDAGPLSYHVRYTPDGGAHWHTLATEFIGTSLEVPRDELTASPAGRVEVQATDGTAVTVARSGPFAVANSAPRVTITSADRSDLVYSGDQNVLLEAFGSDPEDGDVDASITWSSDVDGVVLRGPDGAVPAGRLSAGRHTLTVAARDSAGLVGTASLQLTISRLPADPAARLAATGQSLTGPGLAGLLLIGAGSLLVILTRRRQHRGAHRG